MLKCRPSISSHHSIVRLELRQNHHLSPLKRTLEHSGMCHVLSVSGGRLSKHHPKAFTLAGVGGKLSPPIQRSTDNGVAVAREFIASSLKSLEEDCIKGIPCLMCWTNDPLRKPHSFHGGMKSQTNPIHMDSGVT